MLSVSTYHFLNKVSVKGVIFASLNTESCNDVGLRLEIGGYIYVCVCVCVCVKVTFLDIE